MAASDGPGRAPTPRIPPHNLEAEESLLGAMMLAPAAIGAAVELVRSGDFYKPAHGHIYEAISALYASGEPADPVTVAEELRRAELLDDIGGAAVLAQIQARTPATSNAGHYAGIVKDNALLRRLIAVAGDIAELGYHPPDDAAKALDEAESLIFQLAERRDTDTTRPLHSLLEETLSRIETLYDAGRAITGTPTGYTDLDELLSGLQPSALVIVGARPAMGKTSFALGAAAHAAINERVPTLVFSLEMSHLELAQRIVCSEGRIDTSKLRNGSLRERDWNRLSSTLDRMVDAPLWIDDNPNLTIMEIRSKARRLTSQVGKLGLIIVDYLQLMTGRASAENRQVEVSELSRGLKILARELECPVVALSQLSRALELRADKRPMLADLRESGSIEQDADVVLFLYRDEVYHPDSADLGTAEVIVAKHRSGPTGTARLAFLPHYTKFENFTPERAGPG